MLIPIGVIFYTAAGGLKATFIASYVHTAVIYIVLVTFTMLVYAGADDLGSPSKVWQNLAFLFTEPYDEEGNTFRSIKGNRDGHPLTFFSRGGLIFGIINIIGNFGTVRGWSRRLSEVDCFIVRFYAPTTVIIPTIELGALTECLSPRTALCSVLHMLW